ncbi:MAG TPA: hypothetical protein VEC37_18520 [Bacillota bacterium]|nr:hypothetical protein [Bacillota bacterium]
MKKKSVLIGFTTLLMLLVFTTSVLGASLYLDIMQDGTTDTGYDFDTDMTIVGASLPYDDFQFDFEYIDGELTEPGIEFNNYSLKAGYTLVKHKDLKLIGKIGYLNGELELGSYDLEFDSMLLGLEADFKITGRTSLNLGLDYGFCGESALGPFEEDLDSLLQYQIKLNYLIDQNLGLSLGYRATNIEDTVLLSELNTRGLTFGVFYTF